MEGLPKRPYRDGWPEEKWQEEMEKHPFFMTQPTGSHQELSPLVEGLQQLKFDESENTPDELASTYKDEGNFCFKCKKYREAIMNYSAGLKYDCSSEIKASLYNNRGAANFFLRNYRSSLLDSENALKLKPDYLKAEIRAAQCCYFLEKYDECIEICDRILLRANDDTVVMLKKKALSDKKVNERNSRKRKKLQSKESQEEKKLLDIVASRGIKILSSVPVANFAEVIGVNNIKQLQPCFNEMQIKRVHFDGEELIWPVVFLYFMRNIFDYVQEFNENDRFQDHVNEILRETPEWDAEKKYQPNAVNIYFKDEENRVFKVDTNKTLREILQHERLVIKNGVPLFYVLPQSSREEEEFINTE